ncbi:MAG: ATP-binding protein [Candidatus Solibacter sp.]
MPEIELTRLRQLKRRAETLLGTLVDDLKPFKHKEDAHGFRRTPESKSLLDDVNVTTTCSCLMSLALSGKLAKFYGKNYKEPVKKIFDRLLGAPWMSSGLAENNAFTTSLSLRLLGFLVKEGVLSSHEAKSLRKDRWETDIEFVAFDSFARRLAKKKDPFCEFLYDLLPSTLQTSISSTIPSSSEALSKLKKDVSAELGRLIRTTSFYDSQRFKSLTLSTDALALLSRQDDYKIAQLNRILLHDVFHKELPRLESKSLREIAFDMSAGLSRFQINNYPPAAAVLYWFVDGVSHSGIALPEEDWTALCRFATEEFGRQRSLAVARHAAMMDPVAVAMAACLCARLRTISKGLKLKMTNKHHKMLPSTVELASAVVDVFNEQTLSGIWPKYFPLFHYPDAGSNFCFTFELLEAVLVEFTGARDRLLTEPAVMEGLERAVQWCEANRLKCAEKDAVTGKTISYEGWNSGGNLVTLGKGQPESWATAVVHMFLRELVDGLSRCIQQRLLDKYSATKPGPEKGIDKLLDIDLWLEYKRRGLISTLKHSIITTFSVYKEDAAERLRKRPIEKEPLSALLFGPPGTSKTEIAKAVAAELHWPLVEIDPSHFLKDSFQNLYVQAETIFEDVMDMCGVVVLFDEKDALVQKRDSGTPLDTESKFLTTYMLPKLAKLHDRGQIVFMMATNFVGSFDDAIKRAGRFDYLLCMGPPTLKAKCGAVHVFFGEKIGSTETELAGKMIDEYIRNDYWLEGQLSLYTFGEFKSFISALAPVDSIGTKIRDLAYDGFRAEVVKDKRNVSLRMDDLESLHKIRAWKRLRDLDRDEFNEEQMIKQKIDLKIPAIKYGSSEEIVGGLGLG